ncbi:hypothetical protein N7539_004331 [Penicillium diatomitis]|uniref:Uncharacterized protein n=1 Tax=Penicillium diatomitis TaxID=2819901 RepID=A0A9W9XDP6_9EURO|nr:uncharacterized protein N7539_004331 [Penicillium diatomitis]KAJ5489441.1 hypothetical protein N7539_004331 [Penicillium diatomitis]
MASSSSKNSPALSHSSAGTKSPATQASTLSLESSRYVSKDSPLDPKIDPNQPIELSGPDHKPVFPPKYTKKPTSHHSHSRSGEPYPSRERGTGPARAYHHNSAAPEERRSSTQQQSFYTQSASQPPLPQHHSRDPEYYPNYAHPSQQQYSHHHPQHQHHHYPHHPSSAAPPRQPIPPVHHQQAPPPGPHYASPEPSYYHGQSGPQSQSQSQSQPPPHHGHGHPAMTHRPEDYYHDQQPPRSDRHSHGGGPPPTHFYAGQDQFLSDRRQDGLPRMPQDDYYESRQSLEQHELYQSSARLTPQAGAGGGGGGARIKIEPDDMDIDHMGRRATPEKQIVGVKRGRS